MPAAGFSEKSRHRPLPHSDDTQTQDQHKHLILQAELWRRCLFENEPGPQTLHSVRCSWWLPIIWFLKRRGRSKWSTAWGAVVCVLLELCLVYRMMWEGRFVSSPIRYCLSRRWDMLSLDGILLKTAAMCVHVVAFCVMSVALWARGNRATGVSACCTSARHGLCTGTSLRCFFCFAFNDGLCSRLYKGARCVGKYRRVTTCTVY
jgi:hypothetical protein